MTQNFIQPKGSLKTQIDTSGLQSQLAQMFANQQLQGQVQQQAEAADPMRQTVQDYLSNKMLQEIEMPKYTTIQDVLGAQKGEKFNTFLNFLNNPETMRTIGNLLPYYGYNPKTGQGNNVMESPAQRQENQMKIDQANALAQLKEQNDIAKALNNAYTQSDIAKERYQLQRDLAEQEMKWKREEAALDRALKREGMANDLQRAMIIHGALNSGGSGSDGGVATGGASGINNTGELNLNNIKMTAAERKQLTENKTTLANIESGLKALEDNPNAYQWYKGILGPDVANRIDPKGVGTRTQIDNITAVYRKWLTGAQMSDKERKAYERFLPAPTDNYNIVKAKLEGMRGAVSRSNDAILSNYGISANANSDPLGLGF